MKYTSFPYSAGVDQLPPAPSKPISGAWIPHTSGSSGFVGSSFINWPTCRARALNRWYSLAT